MPVINGSLGTLFAPRPVLLPEHQAKLAGWFATALGKNLPKIFIMQADMVNEIRVAEMEIQSLAQRIEAAKAELSLAISAKDVARIRQAQAAITAAQVPVEHWRQYWHCIKLVGDTIATRCVDVDYFKAFSLAQSTGYLSGKDGLKAEMDAAIRYANEGYFVILNDLTNCLKGGDLTLMRNGETKFVEVKANPKAYRSSDTRRQVLQTNLTQEYIENDTVTLEFENEPVVAVRLDGPVQEYHDRVPGQLLRGLGRTEVRHVVAGAKHYLVGSRNELKKLEAITRELVADGDWLVVNIADRVRDHGDTPPFTNYFRPEHAARIAAGELIVLSGFSMNSFAALARDKGLGVAWRANGTELPHIIYSVLDPTIEMPGLDAAVADSFIGQWFWEIILYSLMALESFVAMRVHGFSPLAMKQAQEKRDAFMSRTKGQRPRAIGQLHPSTVKAIHRKRGKQS